MEAHYERGGHETSKGIEALTGYSIGNEYKKLQQW